MFVLRDSCAKKLLQRLYSTAGRPGPFNVPNYPVDLNQDRVSEPTTNLSRADYNNTGRIRCYNCGQMGHISYDCKQPQVRKACYICGNPGHMARDCSQKVKINYCHSCQSTGHVAAECPDRTTSQY